MKNSQFANQNHYDRMLFIAKLHHAIWHDQDTYNRVEDIVKSVENKLPKAKYFNNEDSIHNGPKHTRG
jgi:hypothetical protein